MLKLKKMIKFEFQLGQKYLTAALQTEMCIGDAQTGLSFCWSVNTNLKG